MLSELFRFLQQPITVDRRLMSDGAQFVEARARAPRSAGASNHVSLTAHGIAIMMGDTAAGTAAFAISP